MTHDENILTETGPYLTDPEIIQSAAGRLVNIDDVRFVLVARSPRSAKRRSTVVRILTGCGAILIAAMLLAPMVEIAWTGSFKTLTIWIALMIPWIVGEAILSIMRRRTASKAIQAHDERIYALTGTHLHRITVVRGREKRTRFPLAKAEYSARQMAGHTRFGFPTAGST
jgi:hypothetical protein